MKKCRGKSTLFFLVLLLASFISNAQITWDGSSSTDWNTTANWSTNSVPTSSDDVIIPDVTNDPVLSSSSDVCKDMTIQNGAILTSNNSSYKLTASSITVNDGGSLVISNGDVEITGTSDINGILEIGTGTFDANGTFDATGGAVTFTDAGRLELAGTVTSLGTLTELTGTVEYDGGTQNVLAESYYNLVIDQSGDKTAQGGTINVANDMTISNSATFSTGTNHINITGATTVSATLDIGNAQFNCYGGFSATGAINFSYTGGKLNFFTVSPTSLGTLDNTSGTVDYELGAINVLSGDYYNLRIKGGGTAKTLQGDVSVAGDLIIDGGHELNLGNNIMTITGTSDINGVLDFNNGGQFRANGTFDATGGTVQFTGSGGSLRLGGATVTSLGNTFTEGTGSVRYNHSGTQIVLSETYYNLGIKNAGTKSAGGALDIDGTLNIFPSGELAMGTYDADVATGNTVNIDGTLSITTGTFSTNGSNSDIDGTLSINGAGIYDADGTFDATGGNVTFTGAGRLQLGGTVTSLGTLTELTGTVEYDGGAQNVYAESYYNLEIDGTGDKTLSGNTTISNQLTFSADQDLNTNGSTLTITQSPSGHSDSRLIRNGTDNAVSVAYSSSSTNECLIPVGIDGSLRDISITAASATAETFTTTYTPGSPYNGGTLIWGAGTNNAGSPINSSANSAHVNNHYYYDISRTGSVNATLKLKYAGLTQPASNGDKYILHWDGSEWDELASTGGSGYVTALATSFSPFTQGSGGGALPIDLVSFTGECKNGRAQLEFVVASQINNDYYTIERSVDGNEWSEIGLIEGEGNTSTQMTYNWTDDNPFNGVSYYRLAQTDYDGTSEIFDPIAVTCESSITGYSVYPNPANEVLNIDIELTSYQGNDVEIEIMDINGRVIQSQHAQLDRGYNHLEVDLSEIPSGLYMINFAGTKNYIKESRIIKQ